MSMQSIATAPRDVNALSTMNRVQLMHLAFKLGLALTDEQQSVCMGMPIPQLAQSVLEALQRYDAEGSGHAPMQQPAPVQQAQMPAQQPVAPPPPAMQQAPQPPPMAAPPLAMPPPSIHGAPVPPPPAQLPLAPPPLQQGPGMQYPAPPQAQPAAPPPIPPPAPPPQAGPPPPPAAQAPPPLRQPQTASDPGNSGSSLSHNLMSVLQGIHQETQETKRVVKSMMVWNSILLRTLITLAEKDGMSAQELSMYIAAQGEDSAEKFIAMLQSRVQQGGQPGN